MLLFKLFFNLPSYRPSPGKFNVQRQNLTIITKNHIIETWEPRQLISKISEQLSTDSSKQNKNIDQQHSVVSNSWKLPFLNKLTQEIKKIPKKRGHAVNKHNLAVIRNRKITWKKKMYIEWLKNNKQTIKKNLNSIYDGITKYINHIVSTKFIASLSTFACLVSASFIIVDNSQSELTKFSNHNYEIWHIQKPLL